MVKGFNELPMSNQDKEPVESIIVEPMGVDHTLLLMLGNYAIQTS